MAPVFENSRHSKWLPLDSTIFGPPRRWSHTREYCENHDAEWREVIAASQVSRKAPLCVNYPASALLDLVASDLPAVGVAVMRHARVVSPHGWIVADGDRFLPDHCWFGADVDKCPVYTRRDLKASERLTGVTLNLLSDWTTNYAHMLFDGLSRTHLFKHAGFDWRDVSHVLVPDLSSEGRMSAAELCGIPMDRAVTPSTFSVVECDQLIAPTFPGLHRNIPPWVATFWHSRTARVATRGRRLFISRSGAARNVSNERALAPVLAAAGFETIGSTDRTIRDNYPEAEIVIGAHGAALADVVFCNPGSVLIELMPPGHVFPYYYTAADSAGMTYLSILGEYPDGRPPNTMTADFMISPTLLRETIAVAEAALGFK